MLHADSRKDPPLLPPLPTVRSFHIEWVRQKGPFTLVVHDERQLMAACLWPDVITSLPSHSGACSNQNVLNPLGAYTGVQSCGCRREDPREVYCVCGYTKVDHLRGECPHRLGYFEERTQC